MMFMSYSTFCVHRGGNIIDSPRNIRLIRLTFIISLVDFNRIPLSTTRTPDFVTDYQDWRNLKLKKVLTQFTRLLLKTTDNTTMNNEVNGNE